MPEPDTLGFLLNASVIERTVSEGFENAIDFKL